MTQHCETTLERLLQDIAQEHPSGLRHADFVTAVLKSGYISQKQPVTVVVHQAIMRMVNEGVLVKSEDENRGVREYRVANACAVA